MVDHTQELGFASSVGSAGDWRHDINHLGWNVLTAGAGEHVPELVSPQSRYRIFDKMETDSRVASTVRAIMQPLMDAGWSVDPRNARPEVTAWIADSFNLPIKDTAKTVHDRLGDKFDWNEFIYHAFLSLVYGFMPFEIVYKVDEKTSLYKLHKLAARMPHTIPDDGIKVDRDGGLISITQRPLHGGQPVTIPVEKLLVITHEMRDKNWRGRSIMRPIYADWKLKRHALQVNSIHVDRNGAGVVVATGPDTTAIEEGKAKDHITKLHQTAMSVRAGSNAAATIPHGAKLELKGVYGSTVNILGTLEYHNAEISNSLLQFFVNLANSSHGSHAQSKTVTETYNSSLNATATRVGDTITAHVVEDLVTKNWGPDEPSPAIVHAEIGVNFERTVAMLTSLKREGLVFADRDTEDWLRREIGANPLGLPKPEGDAPVKDDAS